MSQCNDRWMQTTFHFGDQKMSLYNVCVEKIASNVPNWDAASIKDCVSFLKQIHQMLFTSGHNKVIKSK